MYIYYPYQFSALLFKESSVHIIISNILGKICFKIKCCLLIFITANMSKEPEIILLPMCTGASGAICLFF